LLRYIHSFIVGWTGREAGSQRVVVLRNNNNKFLQVIASAAEWVILLSSFCE